MRSLLALAAVVFIACPLVAGPPAAALRSGTPCSWEALFREGTLGCRPEGPTRGAVLYADGLSPRVAARLQEAFWKGKNFHCDGTFTNRWLGGLNAVTADVRVESSWLDGQPCHVMQYPPKAPVFGNVRDELREIAPGVWLGRSYDAATGRGKNWFVLQKK